MLNFRSMFWAVASLLLLLTATPALSAGEATFAEYKYVLQISDLDPSKQELVLSNASNLLDAYPPGSVTIEVVAYGPGLRLLFEKNVNSKRIDSLSQSGVTFSACNNTLQAMSKQLGYQPKLNPDAKLVPGGVVRIGELEKQGYIYIRP